MSRREMQSSVFSGASLQRVPWTPGAVCPACAATVFATDDGGSRCFDCAVHLENETDDATRARRARNVTERGQA